MAIRRFCIRQLAVVMALASGVLVAAVAPAAAATRFVNCAHGEDLQATIDSADAGDVVIASGTCVGRFRVTKDLTILGFFSVTLDGAGTSSGFPVLLVDGGANLVLENAVVTGGFGGFASHSAGIDVFRGSLVLRNAEVHNNNSQGGGGINVFSGANAVIENSDIHDNISQTLGGGLFSNGTLTVRDTTISDNRAVRGTGAGIFNGGTLTVTDTTISGNRTNFNAGGVANSGPATLTRVAIADNTGGMSNDDVLVVQDSAIVANNAGSDQTLGIGGGIVNREAGTLTVRTSTISGNRANKGGGIHNRGSVSLEATTISNNTAFPAAGGAVGGGVHNEGDFGLRSTILSGNLGTNADCVTLTPLHSHGHNFLSAACQLTGVGVGDRFGTDPKLAAAADNGGPTATMRPLAGSPIVDAGACLSTVDQRGVARPQHGVCDIGAYENRGPAAAGTPGLSGASATPNVGAFALAWTQATDPDGDPVVYRLERRDADDAGFTSVATSTITSRALTGQPEGTQQYRVVSTDGNNDATPSAPTTIVVDRTAPGVPTLSTSRAPDHVGQDGRTWFRDQVAVDVAPGIDPALQDGSPGSGTITPPAQHVYSTGGPHTVTARSEDQAGNLSAVASLTVHVDDTDPTVTLDACPATALLDTPTSVGWTATDTGAGLAGPAAGLTDLDTSAIGPKIATVEVADLVGHTAAAACAYTVIYDFAGFDAPLKAGEPDLNGATAGKVLPVRFGLAGDQGLDVIASGSPTWTPISCETLQALAGPVPAVPSRSLEYDARKDMYTYWWTTDKAWKQTCVYFEMALDDGTTHGVNIRFK